MNYAIIGIIVLVLFLLYVIYTYIFATTVTIQSVSNLNRSSIITNRPTSQIYNYTYSLWIYVNNFNPNVSFNRIFLSHWNINLDISPSSNNTLYCNMGTVQHNGYGSDNRDPIMKNFPVQKWVQIIISVNGDLVDYYINGKLINSVLHNDPNYRLRPLGSDGLNNDITLSDSSAPWDAYLSKFQLTTNSIDAQTAWNMYLAGNGQSNFSLSQYNANLTVFKNQVQESRFSLF